MLGCSRKKGNEIKLIPFIYIFWLVTQFLCFLFPQPAIVILNVVVEEAEGLEAKDANGYSDPYCMLGIRPTPVTTATQYAMQVRNLGKTIISPLNFVLHYSSHQTGRQ